MIIHREKKCRYVFISTLLVLIFFVSSCSHVTMIDGLNRENSIKKINYLGYKRKGCIYLKDGNIIKGRFINIKDDSVKITKINMEHYSIFSIDQVHKITFKDHFLGFGFGFFQGASAGILFGAGILYIDNNKESEMAGLAVLYPFYIGSGLGSMLGGIIGNKLVYVFDYSEINLDSLH